MLCQGHLSSPDLLSLSGRLLRGGQVAAGHQEKNFIDPSWCRQLMLFNVVRITLRVW